MLKGAHNIRHAIRNISVSIHAIRTDEGARYTLVHGACNIWICSARERKAELLGYIVGVDGIAVNLARIEAIFTAQIPENYTTLRSVLGLGSYYRRFIQGITDIRVKLYTAISKIGRFNCTSEMKLAFKTLKKTLKHPRVLAFPSQEDHFQVDTDAYEVVVSPRFHRRKPIERSILYILQAGQEIRQNKTIPLVKKGN